MAARPRPTSGIALAALATTLLLAAGAPARAQDGQLEEKIDWGLGPSDVSYDDTNDEARRKLDEVRWLYFAYFKDGLRDEPLEAASIHEWVVKVAKDELIVRQGETAASTLRLDYDPAVEQFKGTLPEKIVARSELGPIEEDPAWKGSPVSFAVATQLPLDVPATTPLAWTRGLQPDGTWGPTAPYWGVNGGFIVFVDGRVRYYPRLFDVNNAGVLRKFGTENQTTANIKEALPPGAVVLEFDASYVKPPSVFETHANWFRLAGVLAVLVVVTLILYKMKRDADKIG